MAELNLLQIQNAHKAFGEKILFDSESLSINEGEHIGVIGPNGAGKTTLFRVLVDQEHLDSGLITKSSQLRLGYLEQESDWNISEKVEIYLTHNCLTPIWNLKRLGLRLGLTENHFNSFLSELSGGYRMRVKLLFLIGQEPNLLLLDEPTNFLDLETLLVLENFLQNYKGAFLLISHDREFLRRVTDHIVEVEEGAITKFAGNIDDYFEQKEMLQDILRRQAMSQEAKKKSILDFVARFGAKATKAKQAQSRLKSIEKMETIELKSAPVRAQIRIPKPSHTGAQVLKLSDANLGYGNNIILKNTTLILNRGQHLGIVGLNGAGKSTLLKSLGDQIPILSGRLEYGYQVKLAYFSQHIPEQLDPNDDVLTAMSRNTHPDVTGQDLLNMAGSLLFSGDSVKKKVKVLSGGEKSRIALGQVLLKKTPLLLLDEPTNHLDFETVEALTQALSQYEGALITVSHDRGFISRVAKHILEVHDGELTLYPGTYDEYVWSLQRGILSNRDLKSKEAVNVKNKPAPLPSTAETKANPREQRKQLEFSIKKLKKQIENEESNLKALSFKRDSLNKELVKASGVSAATFAKDLHQVSSDIENLEMKILELMESLIQSEEAYKV